MSGLILSLFPGIGMLDYAFELEGFCVVRGPDLLWGGDVHRFKPPAGVFDGVIGGPPCQSFAQLNQVNRARWGDDCVMPDVIPEFRRCILGASPSFWVMENSPYAYGPFDGERYDQHRIELDNAWLGEPQGRKRSFWSNLPLKIAAPVLVNTDSGLQHSVVSGGSADWKGSRAKRPPRSVEDCLELQGFPRDMLEECPFTKSAATKAVANGVPLPMGRAVAQAVKRALERGV